MDVKSFYFFFDRKRNIIKENPPRKQEKIQ